MKLFLRVCAVLPFRFATVAVAAGVALLSPTVAAHAQQGAAKPYMLTRKSLANSATFTVTQTLAPKDGSKVVRSYKVEVSGNLARLDYEDPNIGAVRYVTNSKGVYFVTPTSNTAVKQEFKGGVEAALKVAFSQVNEQMRGAKRIGTQVVSGLPTDVYKDGQTGATIYISRKPGFLLPVKTVLSNIGGTNTTLVTNIRINPKLDKKRFDLPPGTRVMDGGSGGLGGGGVR